jgi:hypothetical protein
VEYLSAYTEVCGRQPCFAVGPSKQRRAETINSLRNDDRGSKGGAVADGCDRVQ